MAQPDIEDYQVNITGGGLSGKIDVNDLKDVNAPNPADGETLTWNNTSGKWEPVNATAGSSTGYYINISAGGSGITLPPGWSVTKNGTGTYTITHNLGTTEIGLALMANDGRITRAGSSSTGITFVTELINGAPNDDGFSGMLLT